MDEKSDELRLKTPPRDESPSFVRRSQSLHVQQTNNEDLLQEMEQSFQQNLNEKREELIEIQNQQMTRLDLLYNELESFKTRLPQI